MKEVDFAASNRMTGAKPTIIRNALIATRIITATAQAVTTPPSVGTTKTSIGPHLQRRDHPLISRKLHHICSTVQYVHRILKTIKKVDGQYISDPKDAKAEFIKSQNIAKK